MRPRLSHVALTALATLCASTVHAQDAPLADHHQHLFSPAVAALLSPAPPARPTTPITARDLIGHLDAAGIKRAVVLSTAYIFEQPSRDVENAADKVRAGNDWTSQQVAQFPGRLIGFCGINPLKDYALDELARCAKDANLRNGLKLHFGNSVVDYRNPAHIDQVKRVFRAANSHRMPIVVHMRASLTAKLAYGRDEAVIFLNELVPAAPDVVIQIAHLAGAGAPTDTAADQALSVFIQAIANGDLRTKQLYFDATGVWPTAKTTPEEAAAIVARIRQLGVQRVLYGSDGATGGNLTPREGWAALRKLPLTDAEFRTIAGNVPPYLR
jgi:predicted TIM-barrel fold metal-dependent hydrolase